MAQHVSCVNKYTCKHDLVISCHTIVPYVQTDLSLSTYEDKHVQKMTFACVTNKIIQIILKCITSCVYISIPYT